MICTGVMPSTVSRYDFDASSGRFEVVLSQRTDRHVDGIPVRYERQLQGVLHPGRIEQLRGVKARRGVWIPVGTILAEEQTLIFKVGPVQKRILAVKFAS